MTRYSLRSENPGMSQPSRGLVLNTGATSNQAAPCGCATPVLIFSIRCARAAATGLRVGELWALCWRHVSMAAEATASRSFDVHRTGPIAKGGSNVPRSWLARNNDGPIRPPFPSEEKAAMDKIAAGLV